MQLAHAAEQAVTIQVSRFTSTTGSHFHSLSPPHHPYPYLFITST